MTAIVRRPPVAHGGLLSHGAVVGYVLYAAVFVHEVFAGAPARAVLLLAPVGLLVADRAPAVVLAAMIAVLPLDSSVAGGRLSFLLPVLVVGTCGIGVLSRRWRLVPSFQAAIGVLAVLLYLSLKSSDRLYTTVSAASDLFTLLLGLVVCAAAASLRPRLDFVLFGIVAAGVVTATVVITGAFVTVSDAVGDIDALTNYRTSALGLNPNYLGILLAMGAVAALGLALHGRRPFFALAVLPCLASMPMIKSRSSLLLVAVGVFVVLFVGRGVRARTVSVAAIVLLLLAAPTIVTSTYDAVLGERAAADLSQTDAARAAAAQVAFDVAVDHPVLGVGYGNFPVYAAQDAALGFELNTHNDYLRVASEAGLGAFAALVYVITSGVRSMRRLRLGTPALAVALVYCTALLVANPLSNLAVSTGFWVLLGASAGAARAARSADDAAAAPAG